MASLDVYVNSLKYMWRGMKIIIVIIIGLVIKIWLNKIEHMI